MSAAAAAMVPSVAKPQTLDELMLAMDVVDTIRHRELIVERELGQGERDDALRTRLREIYSSQGITVTDSVIDQGIKALRESRFVYTPPAPGLDRSLALLWVRRRVIVRAVIALLVVVGAAWGSYHYLVVAPAEYAAETIRVELAETLPKALQTNYDAVLAEARVEDARTQASALLRDGHYALSRADAAGAQTAIDGLAALQAKLVQAYDLLIVSRPGEASAVWRYPEGNDTARNYYLIVEAIGADGRALTMPIKSEEDGRTYNVTAWGVRVPENVFKDVGRDKQDNNIVDNKVLGQKIRGELEPRYRMSVLGGRNHVMGRQLMLVSGRDALSSVENAINDVRANENRLAQVLSSAAQEAERQRKQLTDSYRALALIRLDALTRNEAVGELDAAERRALELLRTHKAKLDQILIRHGGAQSIVVAAEADHRTKTATLAAAGDPIKALHTQVEAQMAADPAWIAQHAHVEETSNIAHAADDKAKQAEADREIKRKPYEADALFMYLWKRNFATADYKVGNTARYFDRKVAALVGYDTARPNYWSLTEIPLRLREHAGTAATQLDAEEKKLEQIEHAALLAAGIAPLEANLATAQASLKSATDTLAKAQAALAALDQDRTKLLDDGDRQAHEEALSVLTQAIAREDLQTMYRDAQATRTPDDDRLVQQIEQTQKAIAKADTDVTQIRNEAREIARRRSELEGVRDNVRRKQYDGPWGQFEVDRSDAVGDLIGGIVRGAVQGAVLWSLFERGYRHRDWDGGGNWGSGFGGGNAGPRFRLPSSSLPNIGGFKTGGGFRGGGFRTGGRF